MTTIGVSVHDPDPADVSVAWLGDRGEVTITVADLRVYFRAIGDLDVFLGRLTRHRLALDSGRHPMTQVERELFDAFDRRLGDGTAKALSMAVALYAPVTPVTRCGNCGRQIQPDRARGWLHLTPAGPETAECDPGAGDGRTATPWFEVESEAA